MKIMHFNYTKSSGKESQRTFIPVTSPAKNYFGIDISELDETDQAEFTLAYEEFHREFLDKISQVMKQYDISTMYRSFDPEKMTNIISEDL